MQANLFMPPTPPSDGYALLPPTAGSYDVNLLQLHHGIFGNDVDNTKVNTTAIPSASTTTSTVEWPSQSFNGTTIDPRSCTEIVLVSIVLGIIIVFTVAGNLLVVISIIVNAHLRTTTNYFIANLAIADLLLGTTVLPFSASLEVLQYWAFGQIFCNVWAAIDVLCCTASILSLCVISIDRYIGVTRPLQHPYILGHKRAVYVIFGVWVLSGIISVAPLIGWKEEPDPDPLVCTVTQHTGYVLFSTALSFYIPCLILLLVYYRIYRKTVAYTKCIAAGGKLAKVDEENKVVLRIHTGNHRSSSASTTTTTTTTTNTATPIYNSTNKRITKKVHKSYSNNPFNSLSKNENKKALLVNTSMKKSHSNGNAVGTRATTLSADRGGNQELNISNNDLQEKDRDPQGRKKSQSIGGSRITFSSKVARFKREKKAAKTLGIVVGVFITCWLPFFFILPLQSLCASCEIPPLMFKLFFWLGYCNSTMNPIIYTCSSTEFRRAFQSILLCRKCRRTRHNAPSITTKIKMKKTGGDKGVKNVRGRNKNKNSSQETFSYNVNNKEFGNISSGSSSNVGSGCVVSRPCSQRQVYQMSRYETRNGNNNHNNSSVYKSSDLNQTHSHTPSERLCNDCKTLCKPGLPCASSWINQNSTSSFVCTLEGEDNSTTYHYQNSISLQNSNNANKCLCCNNVFKASDLIMPGQDHIQSRDRLPSSCEISMASLSCHSTSPTMSSSGH